MGRHDLLSDCLRPDRPGDTHALGRGERQVPTRLPVLVVGILHQRTPSVGGAAPEQVRVSLALHCVRQS